jgi:RNA polymerase sigma-70 factor (sigma-E family)
VDRDREHREFTEFVHASWPRLYRAAVLLTGDPHLAEDLLQTTYARMFASWRRVSRTGNPVGYARTSLTNAFISHRRLRRSSEIPKAELPERAAGEPSIDSRLDLESAMARLSPVDRAVLVLRYWEDRTVSETASALGLTDQAVRNRAGRALAQLRPRFTPITKEI